MRRVSLTVIGVRHGEVHNPEGIIYSGLPGYGLSSLGRGQAREVGESLRAVGVVALYASPLDRAIETAEAISEAVGCEVRPDIRLHEWRHWAQWAGMTWDELRTKGREAWEAYQADPASVTTGESLAELGDRVESWLEDVRRDHPAGVVVGVTHLEPLRTILLRLLGREPGELHSLRIGLGEAVTLVPTPQAAPLTAAQLRARFLR